MRNTLESPSSAEQPSSIGYSFSLASERHPERNEDSSISDSENNLYAVFDGVGGNYGGSEASQFVGSIIKRYSIFNESENLDENKNYYCELLNYAHNRLLSAREKYSKFQEMDTTAAVVKILKTEGRTVALAFSVGDSRVYSYRQNRNPPLKLHTLDDGAIKQQYGNTPDAMKAQEYFDSLQQPPSNPLAGELFQKRNLINNSIGTLKNIGVSVIEVQEGDILLLTTDGIHDPLTRQEISDTIFINRRNLELVPHKLVQKAKNCTNFRRKSDDRTAIVVKIE